jgi:hypothetical protein
LLKTIRYYKIKKGFVPSYLHECFLNAKSVSLPEKDREKLNLSKKELQSINQGHK